MKFAGKILMLDRLVSELKAERVDPLSAYEREVFESYKRNTDPAQAYEDIATGAGPILALHQGGKLPLSVSTTEAQQAYEDARIKTGAAWRRRRKMKGLFNVRS